MGSASPPGPCCWSWGSASSAVARAFVISSAPPEGEGVAAAFLRMDVRAHVVWINSSATVKPCAVQWNPQPAVGHGRMSPVKANTEGWRLLEP